MNTINDVLSEVTLSSRVKRVSALTVDSVLIWAISLALSVPLIPVWSGLFDSTINGMISNPGLFLFQSFGVVLAILFLVSVCYWTLLKKSPGQRLFALNDEKSTFLKSLLLTVVFPLLAIALVITLI